MWMLGMIRRTHTGEIESNSPSIQHFDQRHTSQWIELKIEPSSLTFLLLPESELVPYNSFPNLRNFPSSFKKYVLK